MNTVTAKAYEPDATVAVGEPAISRIVHRFHASLIGSAPIAPIVAGVITVAAYGKPNGIDVLLAGLVNLFLAWVGLSLAHFVLGLSSPEGANPTSYKLLQSRLDEFSGRRNDYQSERGAAEARQEFDQHRKFIEHQFKREGPQWILGHEYIDLWRRVHRAEEEWIEFGPAEEVVAYAEQAELGLKDSAISRDSAEEMKEHLLIATPGCKGRERSGTP